MKKIITFLIITKLTYAIVPTIDQQQLATDITAMSSYGSSVGLYLNKLGQTITVVDQIKQLNSLNQLAQAGNSLCALCSSSDETNLANYINNINNDLCSQFSFALQNIENIQISANNINDVILLLQSNPKAASLALQRAAIQTQLATHNSMAQIQLLLSQDLQKKLAQQKLEKQITDDSYIGFANSGL